MIYDKEVASNALLKRATKYCTVVIIPRNKAAVLPQANRSATARRQCVYRNSDRREPQNAGNAFGFLLMLIIWNVMSCKRNDMNVAMPKRKPEYNPASTMQQLLNAVCDFYGDPVDDRKEEAPHHVSLHDVADEFDMTVMKARKLLITGGLYSTALSRRVQELHCKGLTVSQITEETGLKRSSINSYLPYAHIIYNLPDISIKAERQKQYRVRKRNNARNNSEKEEKLWQEMIYLQGCLFTTSKGLNFTYKIHGGEMLVDRKEKSITRATVMNAYRKVVELNGIVKGPKMLGTFGAGYLYPVFVKMGLIKATEA